MNNIELMLLDLTTKFNYDPEIGKFVWKISKSGCSGVGNEAGGINTFGYRQIRILGKLEMAHRLAWLWYYKDLPDKELDHINGNKLDNRISNLREVTRSENVNNNLKPLKHNKCGFRGVSYYGEGVYKAQIRYENNYRSLGLFKTAEEAHSAYLKAKKELHLSTFYGESQ